MEELAGFMKPMLDAIVGAAIQSAASLGGVAPWTCVRARIGLMGATGVLCSTSLWFWTAGRATRYPPGPTSCEISLAVWSFGLGLVPLTRPEIRLWLHKRWSYPRL